MGLSKVGCASLLHVNQATNNNTMEVNPPRIHSSPFRMELERAGVENLTKLHCSSHTSARHVITNYVYHPTVQKVMGHSDIQTTMIYAHLAPDHLADAVDKLHF